MEYLQKNKSQLIETAVFSVGPLCALIAAKLGVRAWLRFELISSCLLATVLLVHPQYILNIYLQVPLKDYHLFICSLYGCYLVYSVLFQLFLCKSQDETIYYGHFWSRIIANSLILVDNVHVYFNAIQFNYKVLCLSGSFALFNVLINAYFLIVSKKPSFNYQFHDFVNHIAKFEAYMLFMVGTIMFAFPDQTMLDLGKGSNETYRSLWRMCGAQLLSLGFESFCMSEFIYMKDKKTFMLARLTGSLLELVVILMAFSFYGVIKTTGLTVFLIINMSYNLVVFIGYIKTNEAKAKAN